MERNRTQKHCPNHGSHTHLREETPTHLNGRTALKERTTTLHYKPRRHQHSHTNATSRGCLGITPAMMRRVLCRTDEAQFKNCAARYMLRILKLAAKPGRTCARPFFWLHMHFIGTRRNSSSLWNTMWTAHQVSDERTGMERMRRRRNDREYYARNASKVQAP